MSTIYQESEIDELLEKFIDHRSLEYVLQRLGSICQEKADHVRASYNDRVTSRTWVSASRAVINASYNPAVRRVSQ